MFKTIGTIYKEDVVPKRTELFGVSNVYATPHIEKVVLNARVKRGGNVGEEAILNTLERITGQKPVTTKARLSISNFKIRAGMVVGAKVTLRGKRANDFLDKLIHVTLPRVRDFSGLQTKSIDNNGNLSIGLEEHVVFPETASDDMAHMHGLQICINTTATNKKDAEALFRALGFPFKKEESTK